MSDDSGKLTSKGLAELVVDALVDAGLIIRDDFEKAVRIAAEEIEIRKALGDY